MNENRIILKNTGKLTLAEDSENGTVRFKTELIHPGIFNWSRIDQALIESSKDAWVGVDLVLEHEWYNPNAIAGRIDKSYMVGNQLWVEGFTYNTGENALPSGEIMAKLLRLGKEEGVPKLGVSLGAELTDYKWEMDDEAGDEIMVVLGWSPEHVAGIRYGNQADPDAVPSLTFSKGLGEKVRVEREERKSHSMEIIDMDEDKVTELERKLQEAESEIVELKDKLQLSEAQVKTYVDKDAQEKHAELMTEVKRVQELSKDSTDVSAMSSDELNAHLMVMYRKISEGNVPPPPVKTTEQSTELKAEKGPFKLCRDRTQEEI